MNEQEQTIFNRVAGFAVYKVRSERTERDGWPGVEVVVDRAAEKSEIDFFFPDYAGLTDEQMAEIVANNLREELWNSVHSS